MHNWVFLSLFTCIMKMKYMATCIIHIQDLVEGSEVIVLIVLWSKTTLSFILLPGHSVFKASKHFAKVDLKWKNLGHTSARGKKGIFFVKK